MAPGRRQHRRPRRTQSGWSRARSESSLTISGSTQSPKSMPEPLDAVDRADADPGAMLASTVQSPRPARSERRPWNQPSSRTNRSTPTAAAASTRSVSRTQVVVEVHGLPGVESTGRSASGTRLRTQPWMPVAGVVEPGGDCASRPARDWCRSPPPQLDLAGTEQLTATQQALALRGAFGVRRVVAAPGDVGRPHLPGAEAEGGRAGHHQQRRVVPGPTVAAFAQVRARSARVVAGVCARDTSAR